MGKCAIVVGGTRRVGRWVSEALAVEGWSVHALYRSDDKAANEFQQQMAQAGYNVALHKADATDEPAMRELIPRIAEDEDGIEALVNSAGVSMHSPIASTSAADMEKLWRGNVLGVHTAVLAALPYLRISRGRIVNFISIGNDTPRAFRDMPVYAACKAMLASYSRSLARELAGDNVTVNCIALGIADMQADGAPEIAAERIPSGSKVSQEDIAAAIWYLTGPGSSQLTGTVLNLSGGFGL